MSERENGIEAISEHVGRIAMIARWKPVHLGQSVVLEALTSRADHAVIGIGSSNRYDVQNPFTAEETAEMIRLVLDGRDNFTLVEVPDLGHGPRWRAMVTGMFGPLDLFVTANGYVRSLLAEDYRVVHPVWLVPEDRRIAVDGTMVRRAMARGDDWQSLVPPAIAGYLTDRGLAERFRKEFGLETIARDLPPDW